MSEAILETGIETTWYKGF